MSLNYILPNGVTMGFNTEAEKDAWLATQASSGAQTQESVASQGQIEEVKSKRAQDWYSPGGGFQQNFDPNDPGQQGMNDLLNSPNYAPSLIHDPTMNYQSASVAASRDWGSNPAKSQWIAQQSGYGGDFGDNAFINWAAQNGVDVGALEDQWHRDNEENYGRYPDLARLLAQQTGYDRDFGNLRFDTWARANGFDPIALVAQYNSMGGRGGTPGIGGLNPGAPGAPVTPSNGVSTAPALREMRPMTWLRTPADHYLPMMQQQGAATYGSAGQGEADFGLSRRYIVPTLFDFTSGGDDGGVRTLRDGGEVRGPGTGTSDSIPARLSDGEFVMTNDAVAGAGNGSRRDGAKRLYKMIKNFEARSRR